MSDKPIIPRADYNAARFDWGWGRPSISSAESSLIDDDARAVMLRDVIARDRIAAGEGDEEDEAIARGVMGKKSAVTVACRYIPLGDRVEPLGIIPVGPPQVPADAQLHFQDACGRACSAGGHVFRWTWSGADCWYPAEQFPPPVQVVMAT